MNRRYRAMSLREREGQWHYRFQYAGHEYTAGTGYEATERNRKHAQSAELQAWQLVKQGGKPRAERIQFNDAAAQFLDWAKVHHSDKPSTYQAVRVSFTSILQFLGARKVWAISTGDVLDYAAWRKHTCKVKDVTLRGDMHCLSKFYRYAMKHGWATSNPVKAEDIPSAKDAQRIHVFSDDEERAYFADARRYPALFDLTSLMRNQGCRPEELMSLRPDDVDLHGGYLYIRDGKSNAAKRRLRLTPGSHSILAYRVSAGFEWVFPAKYNKRNKLVIQTLDGWHAKVRAAVGVPSVVYDWRHTFATRAAAAGMPLGTLAKILGHADLKSVMKYVHPGQDEQDREMDKLGRTETGRKTEREHVSN